jgi:8-oxo-dGTP pyrophosphatase MutT (NUDIX family)
MAVVQSKLSCQEKIYTYEHGAKTQAGRGFPTLLIVSGQLMVKRINRDGKWLMIKRSSQEAHAAGTLSLVGGKVEQEGNSTDILERTLQSEVYEEVGIQLGSSMHYVHNTSFVADDGDL